MVMVEKNWSNDGSFGSDGSGAKQAYHKMYFDYIDPKINLENRVICGFILNLHETNQYIRGKKDTIFFGLFNGQTESMELN